METWVVVVLVVAAALAIGAAGWLVYSKARSQRPKSRFGPEYERAVETFGSRSKAEADLESRSKRVEVLDIHPLSAHEHHRFAEEWRSTQALFVDDPPVAVGRAEKLVQEVMHARGYPVGNFDQRAADISVDHPLVVENYRAARQLAAASQRGTASTEDLRRAMVHYRVLFEELLLTPEATRAAR